MMPALFSINGELGPLSRRHPDDERYTTVEINRPLSVRLLVAYPGPGVTDWGKDAEIMLSSNVRLGPAPPAPRLVNWITWDYDYKGAPPISSWGGRHIGDPMLYYTKAYAGGWLGITLHATEIDKVDKKHWDAAIATLGGLSGLAMFTPAAPYLAAAVAATKLFQKLADAVIRNDKVFLGEQDLYHHMEDEALLQSGRYVLVDGSEINPKEIASRYRLGSKDDFQQNLLITKSGDETFRAAPYVVFQVNAEEVQGYDDFEIGSESAALLEKWGDKRQGLAIFSAIEELGRFVNDSKQLTEVARLTRKLDDGEAAKKKEIEAKIRARAKLLSTANADLLKSMLDKFLPAKEESTSG